jgi:hypothetical protein
MFRPFTGMSTFYLLLLLYAGASCPLKPQNKMDYKERQLTFDAKGHTINNIQIFSPNDEWIVYDTRNDDGHIGRTGSIEMINVNSGEIKELYRTRHQTEYGPGVGAATFSPKKNRVLFLHGIRNADKDRPYTFTRRTGIAIDTDKPGQPVFMDARNITEPFTRGALRGGTHAHSWSGDGEWISFTYNDYVLEQRSKTDSTVKDLRTVGVMAPGTTVKVPQNGLENNDGEMFSAVVVNVTAAPADGTDEIDKAFDETWIGEKGYRKQNGHWQKHAIAFQGNVRDEKGKTKTEIFVADLPDDITKANPGQPLEGTSSTRPATPAGTEQRRITYTKDGVQGPRHWLRSSPDGKLVAFLAKDTAGIVQIFAVSPNGGNISQLTFNHYPVEASFNFSPDGRQLAYIADHSIFLTDLDNHITQRISPRYNKEEEPVGGVVWSNNGEMLAFNRFINTAAGRFLQIFLLKK